MTLTLNIIMGGALTGAAFKEAEAALLVAAQGFADGNRCGSPRPSDRTRVVGASFFIRPLPRHFAHFGG